MDVLCEVCEQRQVDDTVESMFSATRVGMCNECIIAGREPYQLIVMGLLGVTDVEQIHKWARPYVEATLEFYGKTMEQFMADIKGATDFLELDIE